MKIDIKPNFGEYSDLIRKLLKSKKEYGKEPKKVKGFFDFLKRKK